MLRHRCVTPDFVERRATGGRAECQNHENWQEWGSEKVKRDNMKCGKIKNRDTKLGGGGARRESVMARDGSETQAAVSLRVTQQ